MLVSKDIREKAGPGKEGASSLTKGRESEPGLKKGRKGRLSSDKVRKRKETAIQNRQEKANLPTKGLKKKKKKTP